MMKLIKIKKTYPDNCIKNIELHVQEQMEALLSRHSVSIEGLSIGIAAGSRGISQMFTIIQVIVNVLLKHKAKPFVIPAMGSHGGATPCGQADILECYGISEKTLGIPIDSSMDVIEIGKNDSGCKAFMARSAMECDGVLLVNRVKPHTDYHGLYESGLVKMAVIGLGKHQQALEIHRFGIKGLKEYIPEIAGMVLQTGKILGGIAIVENPYKKPVLIESVNGENILNREPEILSIARSEMPSLPVAQLDILIVDRIGKDISGVGMDTNIIGRLGIAGEKEPEMPEIKAIMVSDLSENTYGNALGVGLADVTTKALFEKIDFQAMYENAFTSTFLERVKIPVIAEDDIDAFRYAKRRCGNLIDGSERVIRISDTLHLDTFWASMAVYNEIIKDPSIKIISDWTPMFNEIKLQKF
jgi:hypothetical protein